MADAVTLMKRAAQARREGHLADAQRGYAAAVAICRRIDAPRELVQALKGLGQIERDLSRGDAARALYEEAVTICRKSQDLGTLAHTLRHLGDLHQDAARMELAEPCYREALALYRGDEHTAPLDLANAIRPLASLREYAGRVEEAKRLWEEARDLYASAHVQEGVDESTVRLARLSHQAP